MLVYDIKVTLSTVKLSTHSFHGFLPRSTTIPPDSKIQKSASNHYEYRSTYILCQMKIQAFHPRYIFFFIIVPLQCNGRQESGQLSDTWGTFIRVTDDHGYNDSAWLACPSFVWWHSPGRLHITDHHLLNYRPEKSGTALSCKFLQRKH